jgi:transglutaminase-like putative cysteine protease
MHLNVGCQLIFRASAPAPLLLMVQPRHGTTINNDHFQNPEQSIQHSELQIEPHQPVREYVDAYGNLCHRLIAPEGYLRVNAQAVVAAADTIAVQPGAPFVLVQDLPDAVLQYLWPSRYCQSDQLGRLAHEIVAGCTSAYDQVEAIRHWIHTQMTYQYATSNASTSALDTLAQRQGVCRDFAHLGIALCRSIAIPARMVVGYLHTLRPMDLHAWFEAYVGDRWYTFDATQVEPLGNRVVIGYGRDAADVAFATQFGPLELLEMRVWVTPHLRVETGGRRESLHPESEVVRAAVAEWETEEALAS